MHLLIVLSITRWNRKPNR